MSSEEVNNPKSENLWVWLAAFIEGTILPVIFLYCGFRILIGLGENGLDVFNKTGMWSIPLQSMSNAAWLHIITNALSCVIQFSIALILVINRKPVSRSQSFIEIFLPLLASFFFVLYNFVAYLPPFLKSSLIADHSPWRAPFAFIGLVGGAIGVGVSAWGIFTLGRSFGVLVSVRQIVFAGPYKYVRHPIYLGYLISFSGMLLANPAPAYFILFPIHFGIMVWRAHLEENRLAAFSPEYKASMAKTGFILPRLARK